MLLVYTAGYLTLATAKNALCAVLAPGVPDECQTPNALLEAAKIAEAVATQACKADGYGDAMLQRHHRWLAPHMLELAKRYRKLAAGLTRRSA